MSRIDNKDAISTIFSALSDEISALDNNRKTLLGKLNNAADIYKQALTTIATDAEDALTKATDLHETLLSTLDTIRQGDYRFKKALDAKAPTLDGEEAAPFSLGPKT